MVKTKKRLVASLIAFMMLINLVAIPTNVQAAGEPTLKIEVPETNYEVGETFIAQVKVSDVTFNSSQITVYFDPEVLQVVDSTGISTTIAAKGLEVNTNHMFIEQDWSFSTRVINNVQGLVDVGIFVDPEVTPKYTVGTAEDYIGIRFKAIANGDPDIHFATSTSPAHTPANKDGYIFAAPGLDGTINTTMNLIEPSVYVGTAATTYTVTFVDHDDSVLKTEEVEEGQAATAPSDPTREGYTFTGWDVGFTNVTEDMTVKAQYTEDTATTYTVTFVDHDDSVLKTEEVEEGQAATAPSDPTREGYTFTGWDVGFTNVTEDMTVKAQYTEDTATTYTVTFVDHDDSVLKTEEVEEGQAATAPSDPTREGYTFTGWDVGFTNVTEDMTVKAQYTEDTATTYTVTFVDHDDSVLKTEEVEEGQAATAPSDPTREGYTFTGWDVGFTNVTEDMTVKAQYTEDTATTYTVTFVDHDDSVLKTEEVEEGQAATAPSDPTREGYTFTGWDVGFTNVTEDMTVKAQYTEDTATTYTVTFVDHDDSVLKTEEVEEGQAATAPSDPTREGYTFTGWDVGFTNVTEDMTVKAQYTEDTATTYTVTFVDHDDSVLKTEEVEEGQAATAPSDPTREGYTFTGWDVGFTNVTEDMTVKAQYTEDTATTYTVTFVDHDDSVLKTEEVEEGQAATAPSDPTREGYTFTGWDVGFTNVTEDMTVKAQYTEDTATTYTVTFVDHDDSVLKTEEVEEGQAATAPSDPTREGYTFTGWDVGFTNVTEDMTVKAQYTEDTATTYTVTFVDHDDSVLKTEEVEEGQAATAPSDPTREGYTFTGWDVGFTNVTEDMTVKAQYTEDTATTYTVTFVDHDDSVLKTEEVEEGQAATAPSDPTREGYTFTGWDVGFTNVTEDMTVKAQYTEDTATTYTVTFVDHDDSVLKTEEVEEGQAATAPSDPTREGYTFTGWDVGFTNVTEDMTVKAQYTEDTATTYTVTFVDHDDSVLKTEEVEEGQAATAPSDPTREGYTFTGWDVGFTNVTEDMTVKAQYTEDTATTYTVTFVDHNDSVLKTEEVEEGQAATAPSDPTREGYTFTGWDVAFDNVTSDLTVKAKYTEDEGTPDTYTVTITGDAVKTTDYTIAGAADLTALEGEVILTITAVKDIRVNGSKVSEGSTKEITINKATTIKIDKYTASSGGGGSSSSSSTITTYTIKTSAGKGGIIDADKTVSVRSGRNVEFEIKADEGYEIEDVKVDGKSVGAVSSYEFKRVKADHTISATFKKIEVIEPEEDKKDDFIDVSANEWYYDPIMKATDKGWFSGTSDTTFSPNVAMSRGMIVTVLWRMENEPVSNVNSFADIMANNYYTTAVNWASEKGIVTGYGNDLFGPNDSITREQMASILYRYAQYKGYDTTQGGMVIREFLDYDHISEYALPPLAWGVNTGLIQGANNKLMPKDSATRAQVATILVRFSETIVK